MVQPFSYTLLLWAVVIGYFGFGDVPGDDTLSESGDLTEAATRLFDLLHQADASDKPEIAVALIPEDGIGEAINDRLRRAAYTGD